VWMGDEVGMGGVTCGEDSRRPMPWENEASWDNDLFEWYRQCIAIRRSSDALAVGSLRWLHVGADVVVYLRETPEDRLLCCASRAVHAAVQLPTEALLCERIVTVLGDSVTLLEDRIVLPADGPSFHVWRLEGSTENSTATPGTTTKSRMENSHG